MFQLLELGQSRLECEDVICLPLKIWRQGENFFVAFDWNPGLDLNQHVLTLWQLPEGSVPISPSTVPLIPPVELLLAICTILSDACKALATLHSVGLAHLDLKTEHLLCSAPRGSMRFRLSAHCHLTHQLSHILFS